MSRSELVDQVYCLERIVRFHVVAAHRMSKEGINCQGYSEQQELEQLGKALLSLTHAYEDCKAQGVQCENETEFRAYHVLWGARSNPSILEEIQVWGWKFWESEEIQLAVSLVEALQTDWDQHGPLKPFAETDITHNAFARFFSIIDEKRVSYTMACFAETFFNYVRKSILKTILKSYRKQRDQTKDWTIARLNEYLHFDEEDEVIDFCEKHGLHIGQDDSGDYLSFDYGDSVSDPSPPLPQGYSEDIVERKRGNHSLPEVINQTVFEDPTEEIADSSSEEDEGLFVKDDSTPLPPQQAVGYHEEAAPFPGFTSERGLESAALSALKPVAAEHDNIPKQASLFDRIQFPNMSSEFSTTPPLETTNPALTQAVTSSVFTPETSIQSNAVLEQAEVSKETNVPPRLPLFSFLNQSTPQPTPVTQDLPSTTPAEKPGALFFHQNVPPPPIHSQPVENSATLKTQTTPNESQPQLSSSSLFPNPTSLQGLGVSSQTLVETAQGSMPVLGAQGVGNVQAQLEVKTLPQPDPQAAQKAREAKVNKIAEWFALGDDGLLQQFMTYQVEHILHEAASIFVEEEKQRLNAEADQRDREEADRFRYRSLAAKYIKLWRKQSHLKWLRRRGRKARQARVEYAESMRAAKEAQAANLVEDFKASTSNRRREGVESMLHATGVLNGVHDMNGEARAIVQSDEPEHAPKRRRSVDRSTQTPSTRSMRKHNRVQSDNPLRRSLMSDPSYLQGGSRIHFLLDYTAKDESRHHANGVQTDYFRLKARGITTLQDGTPLASSAVRTTISKKRSLDGIRKPSTPQQLKTQRVAQSVPAKSSKFSYSMEEIGALKAKAKVLLADDKIARQKRAFAQDEEELFARAKRVREQMDEGADWYKRQIEKYSNSRSVS